MRATIWMGVMALSAGLWGVARAQLANSPLYQPTAAPPTWPAWQGEHDGRAGLATPYVPPARYPSDSRNPVLDSRAPTLWPAGPDLRDSTPRVGPPLEGGAMGTDVRRPEGLRSPALPEPGRRSWR